jgi:hypothetical protein
LKASQTAEKQAGPGQQHHRQRGLAHDERGAQGLASMTGGHCLAACFQDFVRTEPSNLPCGRKSKQHTRHNRYPDSEQQHAAIELSFQSQAGILRRNQQKEARAGVSDRQPQHCAA